MFFSGAMKAEINHFAGGSVSLGEWTLLPMQNGVSDASGNTYEPIQYKPSVGGAGNLSFQYEFRYRPHAYSHATLLVDAGIGARAGWTSFLKGRGVNLTDKIENCVDFDTVWPNPNPYPDLTNLFSYFYETSNRQDNYLNVALQIPVMIGMQYYHFYGLAGAKFNVNVFSRARSMGDMSTFGIFDDYIHSHAVPPDYQWRDIPGYQFFENLPKDGTHAPSSIAQWSIDATLELGYRLGDVFDDTGFDVPKRKIEYRIAAFADFGVTNWRKAAVEKGLLLNMPQAYDVTAENCTTDGSNRSMVENVELNDILAIDKDALSGKPVFGDKFVRNLFAGIKFTILFELPKPGQCVICQDSYRSTVKSSRSGRGVKYEEE